MIGIYKITNKINGKCYIGKSNDIERRWREHIKDLTENKHCNEHLQAAFNNDGKDNFEFSIILECAESELNYYETELIEAFSALDNKYGYNMRTGGDGGFASAEVNAKISSSVKELWNNKDYRIHMSEVHIGQEYHGGGIEKGTHRGFDNSYSDAVMILETKEIFGSKSLCAEKIHCSVTAINKSIKENRKCKGYTIVLYNA